MPSAVADTQIRATPETGCRPFWNRQVLLLMAVTFLVYSNNSVFFKFYEHLTALEIAPESFGLLIGIFSSVSLVLRPVVSSFLHPANARRGLYAGALLATCALAAYSGAFGFWSLFLVRLFHGFAFVVLGSALITLMVEYIPRDRSAHFFGIMTIVTLIPNTLLPPVLPAIDALLGGFTNMLIGFGLVTLMVFPLIKGVGQPQGDNAAGCNMSRPGGKAILSNLRRKPLLLTLAAMLCMYSAYAVVFYYLDGYGRSIGITKTGFFLTLATAGEIVIRLLAGSAFDRFHKTWTAILSMLVLGGGYLLLAGANGTFLFYASGIILGLGWGVAMPVFSGILFDLSKPEFRAFNTNLGMQVFQGGFFLGPLLFGPMIGSLGFRGLFYAGAVLSIAAAVILYAVIWKGEKCNLIKTGRVK
jgi:MFS family permease